MTKSCEKCGRDFRVYPCYERRGRGRFCSMACANQRAGRSMNDFKCETCGKASTRATNGTRRPRFCSLQCRRAFSGRKIQCGYVVVQVPHHERALHAKKHVRRNRHVIPEHVLIAQRVLGRALKRNEVVHHINGDKADNRKSNLLVCSRSYHNHLHAKMSYLYQREKF